jgi:hypothetical protein
MLQALSSVGLRGPVFVLRRRRRNSGRCLCVKVVRPLLKQLVSSRCE